MQNLRPFFAFLGRRGKLNGFLVLSHDIKHWWSEGKDSDEDDIIIDRIALLEGAIAKKKTKEFLFFRKKKKAYGYGYCMYRKSINCCWSLPRQASAAVASVTSEMNDMYWMCCGDPEPSSRKSLSILFVILRLRLCCCCKQMRGMELTLLERPTEKQSPCILMMSMLRSLVLSRISRERALCCTAAYLSLSQERCLRKTAKVLTSLENKTSKTLVSHRLLFMK